MSDDAPTPDRVRTVGDRLATAGLSFDRIDWWFRQEPGSVRIDDEPATSPHDPAPEPARVTLRGA